MDGCCLLQTQHWHYQAINPSSLETSLIPWLCLILYCLIQLKLA